MRAFKIALLAIVLGASMATATTVAWSIPQFPCSVDDLVMRVQLAPDSSPIPAVIPPATTQNTITTTAPVSSETTISVGTLAGQVLTWLASAFGLTLTTMGTLVLKRWFSTLGLQMTQQMSDQLDKTLLNGLNIAAAAAAQALDGKSKVEVKNEVVAGAVAYAQDHRAETIQALGLDPKSGKAVEALNARIATLISDPTSPTPAVLNDAKPPQPAAA